MQKYTNQTTNKQQANHQIKTTSKQQANHQIKTTSKQQEKKIDVLEECWCLKTPVIW